MAVIRDVMPAFELFQPTTVEDAMRCCRLGTAQRPGCWLAVSTASTGSRIESSGPKWSSI